MLARRPQRAIRSLDCFLPEGAGSREEKKGAGRGESRLVPASSPLPLLARVPGHGVGGPVAAGLSKSACFFRSPKSRNPEMSLSGNSPRGGGGGRRKALDKGAIHQSVWVKTNTHTPRRGVNREGGLGGRKWAERQAASGQDHRCSDPPVPHRMRPGPEQGASVLAGSHRPAPEPGDFHHPASETRRRRRFPAPGLPEGGASEREALAAASLSSVKSGTEG